MKLLKLYSNKKTFRTVEFKNKRGINIILAEKENTQTKNKKTVNGVGKSLIITLIHYCLGSNSIKCFENQLKDWEFYLDIEIDNVLYTIKRSTNSQRKIYLKKEGEENFKEFGLLNFKDELGRKLFFLEDNLNNLKFRPLISRFIRPQRESYNDYNDFVKKETDYSKLLNTGYLLGLDIHLIDKKRSLKDSLESTSKALISLKEHEIYKKHFEEETVQFQIYHIKDKLSKSIKEKEDFQIAENYNEIEKETKELKIEMQDLNNYLVLLEDNLSKIKKSKEIKSDINRKDIEKMYSELGVYFPEKLNKNLTDIQDFHQNLIINREKKLDYEYNKISSEISGAKERLSSLEKIYNQKIHVLKTTGTLERYELIVENINQLTNQINKLEEYEKLKEEFDRNIGDIKEEFSKEDKKGLEFANQFKKNSKANGIFNSFSKKFYDDKYGGIDIENNTGKNKQRFNINVGIQDDSSDGVKAVGVFSFDLTLLIMRINHKINFIFHDSRLFSPMDVTQRKILFETINENLNKSDFQYICSLNHEQLEALKISYPEYYEKIVGKEEENVILRLSDKDDSQKLLGIHIDLKYDKESLFGSEDD